MTSTVGPYDLFAPSISAAARCWSNVLIRCLIFRVFFIANSKLGTPNACHHARASSHVACMALLGMGECELEWEILVEMIEREIPARLYDGICHTPIATHRRVC